MCARARYRELEKNGSVMNIGVRNVGIRNVCEEFICMRNMCEECACVRNKRARNVFVSGVRLWESVCVEEVLRC